MPDQKSKLEVICGEKGLKMTEQRRIIARVLSDAHDHPDVEEVHRRSVAVDSRISIATVYRTMRLFEDAGIVKRHEFGDGRARYEETPTSHHDHLIDTRSGKVTEFRNDEIERLRSALRFQDDRYGNMCTHGPGCWRWGPMHYECAAAELKRLQDAS